jgi:antitoxin ParD1/3/4
MNEKLSITLPAEMVAVIREQVEAGRYASTSEMLEDALRALAREQADDDAQLAEIRADIAHSLADPRPPVPAKEAFQRLHTYVDRLYSEK